jgi:type II secretory pathway pseudopilin PulG
MTNLNTATDHNILGSSLSSVRVAIGDRSASMRSTEGGYTLVALLAMMTIVALLAMAAAPRIQQQVQRDQEQEAIFRGEQVADAILAYYVFRNQQYRANGDQALPTSIDQLMEGVPIPGGSKTRQILRPSAAFDPMSSNHQWRLVHPRSEELIDFQQAVMFYAGNTLPPAQGYRAQIQQFAVPQLTALVNTGTEGRTPSGSSPGEDSSGPFVGVASRSKRDSVLHYYGIERHELWIFTPIFRN